MNFSQQKSCFVVAGKHHKQISIKSQSEEKSLLIFAKDAMVTFDHNFVKLVTDERNRRIIKDLSACVARLNKGHFLAKFELNEAFEYKNNLKPSIDPVSA